MTDDDKAAPLTGGKWNAGDLRRELVRVVAQRDDLRTQLAEAIEEIEQGVSSYATLELELEEARAQLAALREALTGSLEEFSFLGLLPRVRYFLDTAAGTHKGGAWADGGAGDDGVLTSEDAQKIIAALDNTETAATVFVERIRAEAIAKYAAAHPLMGKPCGVGQ